MDYDVSDRIMHTVSRFSPEGKFPVGVSAAVAEVLLSQAPINSELQSIDDINKAPGLESDDVTITFYLDRDLSRNEITWFDDLQQMKYRMYIDRQLP